MAGKFRFVMEPLPPIDVTSLSLPKPAQLPNFLPRFFVPHLQNRPQDPIIENLLPPIPLPAPINGNSNGLLKKKTPIIINGTLENEFNSPQVEICEAGEDDLWRTVANQEIPKKNEIKSWDALRLTYPSKPSATPFLSEQSPQVFAASQSYAMPHVHPPQTRIMKITPIELMDIMMSNIVGNSSRLSIWDKTLEMFVLHGENQIVPQVRGITEVMSSSIIERFLAIGSLIRRLETFVLSLRKPSYPPTVHAFNHALTTILTFIRSFLTKPLPYPSANLTALWLHYNDTEESLSALASFCFVDLSKSPPFKPLPTTPPALLSHIYSHLECHFDQSSPVHVRAMFAFILTNSSRDYFRQLEESVGIGKPRPSTKSSKVESMPVRGEDHFWIGEEEDIAGEEEDEEEEGEEEFPSFVPGQLASLFPRARRSIKILRAACPEHPLAQHENLTHKRCEWVWDNTSVENILNGNELHPTSSTSSYPAKILPQQNPTTVYQPELAPAFQMFDLEPGTHSALPFVSPQDFAQFLASFPVDLPSSTPTLQHLSTISMTPLIRHSSALSHTLLHLFLCTPTLNLGAHLQLLRSFMLFSAASFASRLRSALFTTTDDYQPVGRGTRARVRARLGIKEPRDVVAEEEAKHSRAGTDWGIGLGLGLSERGTWPPGGAELGFALRRVIVECLDESKREGGDKVQEEAEWRLGFAIRDLPMGEGRSNWLNPMSIEALDFLYLDYKAPHPIGHLLDADILAKYQRIFTFLLRLLRVETVTQTLFQSTLKSSELLFPNLPASKKSLQHLRFRITSFVNTLVSYIFDTAIGNTFDGFLNRFEKLRRAIEKPTTGSGSDWKTVVELNGLMDVFDIMTYHAKVLDNILTACMLKTQQRAIADLLRECMEVVLELGRLVGELRRGVMEEEPAAKKLDTLAEIYDRKMFTFIKVLRVLDDKTRVSGSPIAKDEHASGGLKDLLLRLDVSNWWKDRRKEAPGVETS